MFEAIWKKIIRRERFSLLAIPAFFLWLVSFIYRVLVKYKKSITKPTCKTETPLISIGNISVGGTGKTPIVAFLGQFLLDEGYRVGIVSSGYGRVSELSFIKPGYKVSRMNSSETGDEVKHLADLMPNAVFSVGNKKADAAKALDETNDVDIIIVDDGYQHFALHRDIDIVTYDAGIKPKHLKMFPYGVLREPYSALGRADIIIITRSDFATDITKLKKKIRSFNKNGKLYHARFNATEIIGTNRIFPVKYLEDKSVFLFAGIGNFRMLKKQVFALCADLDYALELSDHQKYDKMMLNRIKQLAEQYDSDLILTTGKDQVKIGDFDFGREFYYLNQTMDLDPGEEKLISYLQTELSLKKQVD